jgi:uncharacterized membrane protein
MNLAHVHLLLNHCPTIGTAIALGLLVAGFAGRSDDLKRASLVLFTLIALITIPAYLSGNAAEGMLVDAGDAPAALIDAHEDAALLAFAFMLLTGIIAWLGLWQIRRLAHPVGWNLTAVLVLSLVTFALMAQAATLGGNISHEEIRSGAAPAASGGWLTASAVRSFVGDRTWVWPASEAVHFIGLCLLFGIVLLINLRLLGLIKAASFAALHRLLPWGILGFAVNTVTGMAFFIAMPGYYINNVSFYWKIALMLIASVNLLYLTVFEKPWAVGPGDRAPLTVKAVAASTVLLWMAVIYFGRMLPFIGNAF